MKPCDLKARLCTLASLIHSLLHHPPPRPPLPQPVQQHFYEAWRREVRRCLSGMLGTTVAQSVTVKEAATDWQLGQHTQENKGVYKSARGDDCPTVPETTEACCSSSQWWLSPCDVKKPVWHAVHDDHRSGRARLILAVIFKMSGQRLYQTPTHLQRRGRFITEIAGAGKKYSSSFHSHWGWGVGP